MTKHSRDRIEVICGSMFSGKTEELIRRLRRAQIARQQIQVFKPIIDNRYHAEKVTSHNGVDFEATPVASSRHILQALDEKTTVVAIDEVQFFDTAVNITANESIFRIGAVGSELIILLSEIVLSVVLYVLFKPVSKTLSLIATVSRLAMTTIHGLNERYLCEISQNKSVSF